MESEASKKGGTMKSAFIQMMAVAVFATSMSAFAMSEKPKAAKDKNCDCTNVGTAMESNVDQPQGELPQLAAKDKENQREQETKQEDTNKKIRQQEKEWNHSLMGIYGG
jgi:hypothetical protein